MKKITVNLKEKYDIIIQNNALDDISPYIRDLSCVKKSKKAVIISDDNVSKLYSERVEIALRKLGYQVGKFIFPHGEKSKTLGTAEKIHDYLFDFNVTRSDFIVALGGGVVGDTAGFVSATYLRGIPFIQLPTSLLAQIDSSVGGKTGVDLKHGKNLVGCFWQPKLVIIDPTTLQTLPSKYFRDGMGEAIKYACIADRDLFDILCKSDVNSISEDAIARCLEIKRRVVEEDEKDTGQRMLLNFGHTLGHAFETFYEFSKYSHGEAVCLGMILIAKACYKNKLLPNSELEKLITLIERYSLPTTDSADIEKLSAFAMSDKKRTGNDINIVLIDKIGNAYIERMPKEKLKEFLTKDGEI